MRDLYMKHKTRHFYNCDQHLLLIKIGIVFTSQYCQSQIQKFSKYLRELVMPDLLALLII